MRLKRSINHTGRKKILRDMVQIQLHEGQSGEAPSFSASLNLDKLKLADEADVYVEAYHKDSSQRFSFGKIAQPVPPTTTKIDEVDRSGRILFRVKVVDHSSHLGRLLASAEQITPEGDSDQPSREHLITVIQSDLGQVPWGLDLSDDGFVKPVLKLNYRIPDAINQIRHSSIFQALVLPAVVRDVFSYIFWDCDGTVADDSWQRAWLDLGQRISGEEPPEAEEPSGVRNWIDMVLDGFSQQHGLNDRLISELAGEGS